MSRFPVELSALFCYDATATPVRLAGRKGTEHPIGHEHVEKPARSWPSPYLSISITQTMGHSALFKELFYPLARQSPARFWSPSRPCYGPEHPVEHHSPVIDIRWTTHYHCASKPRDAGSARGVLRSTRHSASSAAQNPPPLTFLDGAEFVGDRRFYRRHLRSSLLLLGGTGQFCPLE